VPDGLPQSGTQALSLEILEWAAITVDIVGVVVVLLGFALAVIQFVPVLAKPADASAIDRIQMIRCNLGTYLVFALELMIISDLLHSVVSRTLEDLYFLAGVVALRTVIAYFLNMEIREIREHAT